MIRRLLASAALLAALALLTPAAALAQGGRPAIKTISPTQVTPGRALRLTGTGLKPNMVVSFKRRTSGRVTAVLRKRGARFRVTVPLLAATGRIFVRAAGGPKSAPSGPVTVSRPQAPAPQDELEGEETPFDGNVMWLWQLPRSEGGNVQRIIARAKALDVKTIIFKATDGTGTFQGQFTSSLVSQIKAAGIKVCGYSYVYGNNPVGEANVGATIQRAGADCLVIDAEGEYEGKYSSATTYLQRLRALVGDNYPLALAPFPYVDFHASFPYSVFLGPGGAKYNLPQMYWRDIGTSVDEVFRHTYQWSRIYERPIFPIGQVYQDPPRDQLQRFRALARAYGARGVSWWVWEHANDREFDAIGGEVPALNVQAADEWPPLRRGAKGDPTIWLQMHLLASGQDVKVDGNYSVATERAVRAVQTGAGLPATGTMDGPTWAKVLEAAPTAVDWTRQSRPAALRAARAASTAPDAALSKPGR